MDILKCVVLGAVQGLTEFLPVSSSGHIILLQKILGFQFDSVTLALVLHAGTLLSVLTVFFGDFLRLFKPPFKKLFLLVLATLPAAAVGFFWGDGISVLFDGKLLGFAFLFTAALISLTRIFAKTNSSQLGLKQSVAMGLFQAIAVVPGVSRSGSTVFAGVAFGGERKEVVSFSFLMSIPVIAGGCLFSFIGGKLTFSGENFLPLLFGFLSAALFGFFAIKLFLKTVRANNFSPFCIYLIVAAALSFFIM